MRRAAGVSLPDYVAQDQQCPERRMCGAAALATVYRSLGIEASQAEIWPHIARRDERGSWNAATWLLAKAALAQGLSAAVVQASRPWDVLQRAAGSSWRVILNHRVAGDSPRGHFSVLVSADSRRAVIHDPQMGPCRELTRENLLDLWRAVPQGEITGNVLVAIGPPASPAESCEACGTPLPARRLCSACGGPLCFPQVVLGCVRSKCGQKLWARIFCPQCDASAIAVDDS